MLPMARTPGKRLIFQYTLDGRIAEKMIQTKKSHNLWHNKWGTLWLSNMRKCPDIFVLHTGLLVCSLPLLSYFLCLISLIETCLTLLKDIHFIHRILDAGRDRMETFFIVVRFPGDVVCQTHMPPIKSTDVCYISSLTGQHWSNIENPYQQQCSWHDC
jgi:hypothetical protein